jgi:hypothetical protein
MNTTAFSSPIQGQIERLLSGLAGVVSARAIVDDSGGVEEIHVLASSGLHPKQVVRNIESALTAGMGLDVDRRVISVAQMRGEPPQDYSTQLPQLTADPDAPVRPADELPEAPLKERVIFVSFDAHTDAAGQTVCNVILSRSQRQFSGTGSGSNTLQGRATSAARALFRALEHACGNDDLALEGAAFVEAHGRSYVMVGARGLVGRNTIPLTGVAPVTRSPEEAAIMACLQATNRWTELPG